MQLRDASSDPASNIGPAPIGDPDQDARFLRASEEFDGDFDFDFDIDDDEDEDEDDEDEDDDEDDDDDDDDDDAFVDEGVEDDE